MKRYLFLFVVFIIYCGVVFGTERLPLGFINLVDEGNVPRSVVVVEKESQTAYLYQCPDSLFLENKYPVIVDTFLVSTGQKNGNKQRSGDLRTPEGYYHVVEFLSDESLPERYGIGAFPLDYPNPLDQALGKNGYGIWLHGTDKQKLVPYDTKGCVAFENSDLESLMSHIKIGNTAVMISEKIQWIPTDSLMSEAEHVEEQLDAWRKAWMSRDTEAYLAYYHPQFRAPSLKMNLRKWKRYKNRVNRNKGYIDVQLSEIKWLCHDTFLYTSFYQHYQSDSYADEGLKTLIWKKEGDRWFIYRELWSPSDISKR